MIKAVYMGTPSFAATILEALLGCPEVEITAVFTQPDKPVGRKQVMTPPEVKVVAEAHGIPVYQPKHIKREKWVNLLKELQPEVILVAAFGQILSQEILDIPPMGCINAHGSLLPKYRGAAPVQWCIANGESVTGVTAMQMDAGMDTGAMIMKNTLAIRPLDTAETLMDRLAQSGASLMQEVVRHLDRGSLPQAEPQNEAEATYAPILTKEDGQADFTQPAVTLERRIRAFSPWPGLYAHSEEGKAELEAGRVVLTEELPEEWQKQAEKLAFGEALAPAFGGKHPRLLIKTGCDFLEILRLRPQGKKSMAGEDYLRGLKKEQLIFGGDSREG